ncbi:hypothetical protein SAMN04488121_102228 [Chitinophaga filiformis]|uniref:Uncharacterized protein n=1 Tax=Chitinophaga filiformis TaxID=104663 RepID=A0A1G7LYD4_CHIFI|nr:hypothetical protein SAMN04488121_102228 [Chitinophaga filiformis]
MYVSIIKVHRENVTIDINEASLQQRMQRFEP